MIDFGDNVIILVVFLMKLQFFSDMRAPLIFSILNGDSDNHFQMESNTGVIRVAKPLHHDTRSHYDLIVMVKIQVDQDLPQRTATSMVRHRSQILSENCACVCMSVFQRSMNVVTLK